MKKFLSIILCLVIVLCFAACSNSNEAETTAANSQPTSESNSNEKSENNNSSTHKALVVYFTAAENSDVDAVSSASVVTVNGQPFGRVQALAQMIQNETQADIFSIKTSVQYPGDGGKLIEYAQQEQNDNARPEITSHIENLDAYDTVFIGYPIWWYDLPQIMYSFFDEYDFSGKTIIPFCVHNGSQFTGTINTIEELEPNATVVENGFAVSERNVGDAANDVAKWIDEIGY